MRFCGEWQAVRDEMPGKGHALRVVGTCCFDQAGWSADLIARTGNTGINPTNLWLEVAVTAPSGPSAEVLTEVPVGYELSDTVLEYATVTVSERHDPANMLNLTVEVVH
jgi:hypothetical protein